MSYNLNGGLLWGLLMTCLIFASFEIYNDITLGPQFLEGSSSELRPAKFHAARPAPAAHINPNTGYLVFFSEMDPETHRPRDKLGFYMKQSGADEGFFGAAADYEEHRVVAKALDDLFLSTHSVKNSLGVSSPLIAASL